MFVFRLWRVPVRNAKMAQIALKLAIKAFRALTEHSRIARTNFIRRDNPNQPIRTSAPERKKDTIKPTSYKEKP